LVLEVVHRESDCRVAPEGVLATAQLGVAPLAQQVRGESPADDLGDDMLDGGRYRPGRYLTNPVGSEARLKRTLRTARTVSVR
jgi:hypothetical protein